MQTQHARRDSSSRKPLDRGTVAPLTTRVFETSSLRSACGPGRRRVRARPGVRQRRTRARRRLTSLVVMARASRAGGAKTRLEPLLGPGGCARLQSALVQHTSHWAVSVAGSTWVSFSPADARGEFAALVPPEAILIPQTGGSLGARLVEAVEQVDSCGAVIVIGTDAPLLGSAHALMAERQLREGWDTCIVPALDGGYALIALGQPGQAPFALPPTAWGGPEVLRLTLQALQSEGLSCQLLDPGSDLDTPADAAALRADPRCPPAIRKLLHPRLARSRHVYGVTSTPGEKAMCPLIRRTHGYGRV